MASLYSFAPSVPSQCQPIKYSSNKYTHILGKTSFFTHHKSRTNLYGWQNHYHPLIDRFDSTFIAVSIKSNLINQTKQANARHRDCPLNNKIDTDVFTQGLNMYYSFLTVSNLRSIFKISTSKETPTSCNILSEIDHYFKCSFLKT